MTAATSPQNKATEWLARLRSNPKIPLIVVASAAVAIVIALILWAKTPDYRVLYNNLSDQDGGAIVTQLTQMNIPYRYSDNGSAILVPEDKVYDLRLRLAQQGLPKGGAVGFELLDKEKFGISQFSEQINYQRALEGELARTIETLGPVRNARVHLAMPKPTLFVREQKSPSASVTLNLESGRALDEGQVNAIVHMVSSAVAGLPPGNVTLIDQSGRLLTRSDTSGRALNETQLTYTAEVENRYQQRIESILAPIVGSGNVHAQVNAQIDFAAKEQTEEQYRPNGSAEQSAVRSRQLSQTTQANDRASGGIPGALSNQPAPESSAPVATPAQQKTQNTGQTTQTAQSSTTQTQNNITNQSREETTNYEVDKTIRHTQLNVGDVKRLSVAVIVNYRQLADGKTAPLSDEQVKQIESLTREAMGFSTDRGDTLNVVNSPFTAPQESEADILPFWKSPKFFDLLLSAGRWLIVALAGWLLWRKAVKPLIAQRIETMPASAAPADLSADPSVAPSTLSQTGDGRKEESGVQVKLTRDEQTQQRRVNQRMSAEILSQRVRDVSESDPRVVALVIRQWMSTEL